MRAITVRRPFGDAIVGAPGQPGPKRIENRTQNLGAKPGEWIAIHQGASPYAELGNPDAILRNPILIDRFWVDLHARWPEYRAWPEERKGRAGIIGAARVERVAPYRELAGRPWAIAGHEYCIVFDRAVALDEPVVVKGALGLWQVHPSWEMPIVRAIALDERRRADEQRALDARSAGSAP